MKKGNVFIVTGLLLIAAALFLTGYNVWDNYRAGKVANEALEQLAPLIKEDPVPKQGRIAIETSETDETHGDALEEALIEEIEYPDYVLNPNMDMPVKQIDGNEYIGIISIPAIDSELPVFNEWSYRNLKTAPCRSASCA